MKFVVSGLAMAALLGLAACNTHEQAPSDTGSMASPQPSSSGAMTAAPRSGLDTGSMQSVGGQGGTVAKPNLSAPDTGSMAEPSRAQGNSPTRPAHP